MAIPHPALLAIDTAGPRLQLALALEGRVDTLIEDVAKGHAEIIFDRIATLLAKHGLGYDQLTHIAVTTGPGSFTGLRIGLSAAHGLGLGLKIPVIGIPTLRAMSLSGAPDLPLGILVDARRGEAYVQNFSRPGVALDAAQILPLAEAHAHLRIDALALEPQFADIGLMARYASMADPADFPANPTYIRAADAKPQDRAKIIARRDNGAPAP